ncbi:MAG: hypothetical protein IJ471_03420 [Eubacterium sp.]|nr:hypothetical protein [Eubacterium sp.]
MRYATKYTVVFMILILCLGLLSGCDTSNDEQQAEISSIQQEEIVSPKIVEIEAPVCMGERELPSDVVLPEELENQYLLEAVDDEWYYLQEKHEQRSDLDYWDRRFVKVNRSDISQIIELASFHSTVDYCMPFAWNRDLYLFLLGPIAEDAEYDVELVKLGSDEKLHTVYGFKGDIDISGTAFSGRYVITCIAYNQVSTKLELYDMETGEQTLVYECDGDFLHLQDEAYPGDVHVLGGIGHNRITVSEDGFYFAVSEEENEFANLLEDIATTVYYYDFATGQHEKIMENAFPVLYVGGTKDMFVVEEITTNYNGDDLCTYYQIEHTE